ncbi:hypothetical protein GCM10007079_45760 [Nocardiopsis terrae]|uniref:ADP-ribosylglycohydrolase n=1 Tax=Nocardiopsis terrae TaxID=372655 RepID=A0ABR9HL86_9ACTN|nr:hypothetical protein [Nocardiopsis terrae]MBE1459615.1 hypothetical protein [Nocardiopsis terrae]GHC94865.1 hypothetical protein GCM10007079_45760 [Nocardiopsis terrae]
MNATTGNEAHDNTENVDWAALAPEGGERIPELLEQVATSDSALSDLHDIIHFPAPGHRAAPRAVDRLVDIATDEATQPADRWRPLSLLLELVSAHAEDRFPQHRDLDQWRDEVAWAISNDAEKVRAQYRTWMEEAPDEQHHHRMRNRLAVMEADDGAELLRAELETYEAVLARVPDLVTLLHGGANRGGLDRAGEWVSYLLGFLPGDAERISAEITGASQVLLAKDLRPAPKAPTSMREVMTQGLDSGEPLPAELFALGLVADPSDVDTTVGLVHQMAGGNLYNSFAASVALVLIHGENTPREGLRRIGRGGGTSMGYEGLFNESWPHCGNRSPQVLGFLALGRAGDRARRLRLDILPGLIKGEEESRALVTGAGLEIVLGPRSRGYTVEEHAQADYDEETLKVLWAIAELPASAWQDEEFTATLSAWALPDNAEEFCALVGVEPETETGEETEAAAPQRQQPQQQAPTGLLGRLFGGGR